MHIKILYFYLYDNQKYFTWFYASLIFYRKKILIVKDFLTKIKSILKKKKLNISTKLISLKTPPLLNISHIIYKIRKKKIYTKGN